MKANQNIESFLLALLKEGWTLKRSLGSNAEYRATNHSFKLIICYGWSGGQGWYVGAVTDFTVNGQWAGDAFPIPIDTYAKNNNLPYHVARVQESVA